MNNSEIPHEDESIAPEVANFSCEDSLRASLKLGALTLVVAMAADAQSNPLLGKMGMGTALLFAGLSFTAALKYGMESSAKDNDSTPNWP